MHSSKWLKYVATRCRDNMWRAEELEVLHTGFLSGLAWLLRCLDIC
jgi:hypothetical protein